MMVFVEIMHYFIDLPAVLSWTLSAVMFLDYFVLSLLSWFQIDIWLCISNNLLFSNYMCYDVIKVCEYVEQILTTEVIGFIAGIPLYTCICSAP